MSKTIFAVSDVHGHYTELMTALRQAGFDEQNEDHIFLSCGDLFDRGKENDQVYDFVRRLKRKILLKGNHEDSLRQMLACGRVTEADIANETDKTLSQLLGGVSLDADGCFDRTMHEEKMAEIIEFIDSMCHYYETEAFVFTHGWLPIIFEGRYPRVDEAFRHASDAEWEAARLLEWQQLYSVRAMLDGKTIVCGHRPARLGHMFDDCREPDCSEIFYGNGMIALDAGTVRSGRVNVFVAEDLNK